MSKRHEDELSPNSALDRDKEQYPLMRNLSFDPRLLGTKPVLCPTANINSSQRMAMFSHNIVQAPIPKGAEFPAVASGFEQKFIDYTFNSSRIPENGTILAVIGKYQTGIGANPVYFNPSNIVIFVTDKGVLDYVTMEHYTVCSNGFGYRNTQNQIALRPGTFVQKGQVLMQSPAVQGDKYCLGSNLKVCYMSSIMTVEDAFVMSRSAADKLETLGIKSQTISIGRDMVPLNLYGTVDDPKFVPDLYSTVREDGLLCGFRKVNPTTMFADMTPTQLMKPQYHTDILYYGVPEATVVDLSFYMNPVNKVKTPQQYFSQVYTYTENLMIGYRQIYQVYEKEGKAKNRSISPAFNTLLTRVMSILAANGTKISEIKAVPKFVHRGDPIQYIQMDIVYTYPNHVSLGAKTTDREGAKGVNSAILEDEDMPVDDFGERADIVIAPAANINRMNFGQLYEHFLGCAQTTVLREIKHRYKTDYLSAWEYLLTFLYDVNSEYGKIADALHQNERRRRQLIEECIQLDYIPVVVPPGLSNLRPEWVLEMRDKYNIQATPVEYNIRNSDGELIRRVRTVRPVYIGRVYLSLIHI